MSFTRITNAEGCAEVVLAVAMERGFRVEIVDPDIQRDVKFRITSPNKEAYKSARREWGRRLYVGGGEAATRSRL